jgi:hypothetical protein
VPNRSRRKQNAAYGTSQRALAANQSCIGSGRHQRQCLGCVVAQEKSTGAVARPTTPHEPHAHLVGLCFKARVPRCIIDRARQPPLSRHGALIVTHRAIQLDLCVKGGGVFDKRARV